MEVQSILIVDDDPQYLSLLKAILELAGVYPRFAGSGIEALELLEARGYEVLVTDFRMPGIDGVELALKARALRPGLRIIMNTGDLSPELEQKAENAGIRVCEKPFSLAQLHGILSPAGDGVIR